MSNCVRCGRQLSHDVPYGRCCWSRLAGPVAALEASGNAAAAKAAQLLRDGAMARLRGHRGRVWATLSSDGKRMYLTAPEACNCTSGLFTKLCHHRVAVTIMVATREGTFNGGNKEILAA